LRLYSLEYALGSCPSPGYGLPGSRTYRHGPGREGSPGGRHNPGIDRADSCKTGAGLNPATDSFPGRIILRKASKGATSFNQGKRLALFPLPPHCHFELAWHASFRIQGEVS